MKYEIQRYEMAFYWYEKYNKEPITEKFIDDSEEITNTQIDRNIPLKDNTAENIEKNWGKITDMFISIRVLRDNPLFIPLSQGENIKINWIDINYFWDLYWNSKDLNEGEYITQYNKNEIKSWIKETETKYWNVTEICLHFWIRYWDPLFDFFKDGENITITI